MRQGEERHVGAAHHPRIAVAARLAEDRDRDQHRRPGHEPACLRLLHTEVGSAGFANRRDARCQRARHALGGEVEVHRERRAEERHRVEVAVAHEVHMAVDEPRYHRASAAVDLVVAVETRADGDDPAVLDHDISGGGRRPARVEDVPSTQHSPHRFDRTRVTAARLSRWDFASDSVQGSRARSSARSRPRRNGSVTRRSGSTTSPVTRA